MSINKYACHTSHISPTELLWESTYRPHITAHISQRTRNCKIYFIYYSHKYTNYKYTPQMPNICYMVKLLHIHLWWKYATKYATHEIASTNDVARISVHKHGLMIMVATEKITQPHYHRLSWPNW